MLKVHQADFNSKCPWQQFRICNKLYQTVLRGRGLVSPLPSCVCVHLCVLALLHPLQNGGELFSKIIGENSFLDCLSVKVNSSVKTNHHSVKTAGFLCLLKSLFLILN